MRHNGYVLLGLFDLTIVQNLHAHCATHENHYVVECVRNMPLYMVWSQIGHMHFIRHNKKKENTIFLI